VDTTLVSFISESNYNDEMEIFPNPAINSFTLISNNHLMPYLVEIFNTQGLCVFKTLASYNPTTINFNLPPGLYFIRLYVDKRIINKKLVVD
jgi:hypothetical protein